MTDVTIERENAQAALDALDALDLKEDQIVGGQAGRIIIRVPVAAFGYAGRARDALRAALAAQPAQPAAPVGFDRTAAIMLLSAASKSGDPGAISLAAQLAGAAPCKDCGFVNFKCKCTAPPAPAAVPPGFALVPVEPGIALLEAFVGHGLMCGTEPHVDLVRRAKEKYARWVAAAGNKQ